MADLRLRIGLEALDRATAPLRRVRQAARGLSGGAARAAEHLRKLEGSSEQLAEFRKLRAKAWQNTRALADLGGELADAREKLARVTKETGGTGRAFQRASQHVAFLEKKEAGLIKRTKGVTAAQERMAQALQDSGVDTKRAAAETRRLARDIDRATRRANAWARADMHFGRLARDARSAAGAIGAVAGRLSSLRGALGVGSLIGGGALTAGVGDMMADFAASGREIQQWSARLGIGTSALQGLVAVGGRFGIQQDAMIDGLKELSLRADEFATTGGGGGEEAFQRLGLSRAALAKTKGDTEALFELIRGRMEGITDVAARQRIADELFGGTAAEQMVEMLGTSTEELRRLRTEAERMGAILPPEDIAGAKSLSDSIRRLQGTLGGLSKTISARLAPVLEPLITRLGDWVIANRELIATEVASIVEGLGEAIRSVDWSGITAGLRRFGDLIGRAVDWIGGWDRALIAVGVTMNAGLIGSVAGLAGSVGRLGISAGMAAAPALLSLARGAGRVAVKAGRAAVPALASLARSVGRLAVNAGKAAVPALLSLARGALPAVTKAVKVMSRAMWTNPILAVVGGLALAAGWVITNWDRVGPWFAGVWNSIWQAGSDAWEKINGFLNWDPMAAITTAWQPVEDWFGGMWDRITEVFRASVDWIMQKIQPALDAVNWVSRQLGIGGDDDDESGGVANDDRPRDQRGRLIDVPAPLSGVASRFGDRDPYANGRPSGAPANDEGPPLRVVDTAPAVAVAREVATEGGTTVNSQDTHTYNLSINVPQGMDEQAVARLVRQELERHAAAQRGAARAALYDAPQ